MNLDPRTKDFSKLVLPSPTELFLKKKKHILFHFSTSFPSFFFKGKQIGSSFCWVPIGD